MKNLINKIKRNVILPLVVAGSLFLSGCEKSYRKTQSQIDYSYKKEVDSKIYECESLIHLKDLMENNKCKEAHYYLDSFLVLAFNEIESYQSTELNSYDCILSDSVSENLDNKLETMQDKLWYMRHKELRR